MSEVKSKKISLTKKDTYDVVIYIDTTDPDNLVVLDDAEEALLDKDKLPENIFKFKSTWVKPNYILNTIIEMNAQADKVVAGKIQRVFDPNMYSMAQIMVLLRAWNLDELDESFKLNLESSIDNPEVKTLTTPMLKKIGEIQPSAIVSNMYNKAMGILFPVKESEVVKKLKEAKS